MRVRTMERTKIPRENGIFGLYLITRNAIFNGTIMRAKMISFFSKRTVYSIAIALFLILLPQSLFCQSASRSHTVTVIVNPITVMQLSTGTVNLNITGADAIAGQDEMSVTDQSTTIYWGTNCLAQKITIETNLDPQQFKVMSLAVSQTGGTPVEAEISTTPKDFLRDIERSSGNTRVRYTGIALASQGIGTDSHLITFTITTQ